MSVAYIRTKLLQVIMSFRKVLQSYRRGYYYFSRMEASRTRLFRGHAQRALEAQSDCADHGPMGCAHGRTINYIHGSEISCGPWMDEHRLNRVSGVALENPDFRC